MIVAARISKTIEDQYPEYIVCDDVVYDPLCGYLKLLRKGEVYKLYAARCWANVVIERDTN